MHNEGDSVHVSEEEASGGSKEGVVRWVLIVGTLLAILALSIIWITGAATNDPEADNISVSNQIQEEQEDAANVPVPPGSMDGATPVEDGLNVVPNDESPQPVPTEEQAQ